MIHYCSPNPVLILLLYCYSALWPPPPTTAPLWLAVTTPLCSHPPTSALEIRRIQCLQHQPSPRGRLTGKSVKAW